MFFKTVFFFISKTRKEKFDMLSFKLREHCQKLSLAYSPCETVTRYWLSWTLIVPHHKERSLTQNWCTAIATPADLIREVCLFFVIQAQIHTRHQIFHTYLPPGSIWYMFKQEFSHLHVVRLYYKCCWWIFPQWKKTVQPLKFSNSTGRH